MLERKYNLRYALNISLFCKTYHNKKKFKIPICLKQTIDISTTLLSTIVQTTLVFCSFSFFLYFFMPNINENKTKSWFYLYLTLVDIQEIKLLKHYFNFTFHFISC